MMLIGSFVGWIVGILWFVWLAISLPPSIRVSGDGGNILYEEVTIGKRLGQSPLFGIPWIFPGAIAGLVGGVQRGYGAPTGAMIGMGAAGVVTLLSRPWDGWLVLTIPFHCIIGAFIGLIPGAACQITINKLQLGEM